MLLVAMIHLAVISFDVSCCGTSLQIYSMEVIAQENSVFTSSVIEIFPKCSCIKIEKEKYLFIMNRKQSRKNICIKLSTFFFFKE